MRLQMIAASVLLLGMAPSPAAAEDGAPADGVMLQIRTPVTSLSSLVSNAAGAPQFAVGLRRGRIAYGVGLGLSRAGYSDEWSEDVYSREYTLSATSFQVAAMGWFDFWRAPDDRTAGNVVASLSYGRVTFEEEVSERGFGEPYDASVKGNGNLYGFLVGVGGDHHLSSHFSLGLEAGVQGAFASDLKMEDDDGQKVGFSSSILYGAMRATLTF